MQHAPISWRAGTSARWGSSCSASRTWSPRWGRVYEPHRLSGYLFELAQAFSAFYENCPVLKAETAELRESRLTLSALVLRTMTTGLDLLGLESPEQM